MLAAVVAQLLQNVVAAVAAADVDSATLSRALIFVSGVADMFEFD